MSTVVGPVTGEVDGDVDGSFDLVNAALLGTDRRPVPAPPGSDPADWLLDAASRRRATRLVAGATTTVPPGRADVDPLAERPPPPPAARVLLDQLLRDRADAQVVGWLAEAAQAGVGLAPEHWTPMLARSRRASVEERRLLAQVLGPRGLWFARQDPAWSAVVRAAEEVRP